MGQSSGRYWRDEQAGAGSAYAVGANVLRIGRRCVRINGDDVQRVEAVGGIRERGGIIAISSGTAVHNGDANGPCGYVHALVVTSAGIHYINFQLRQGIAHADVQSCLVLLGADQWHVPLDQAKRRGADDQKHGHSNKKFD